MFLLLFVGLNLAAQELKICEKTLDGVTKYGFMDESGATVIACEFDDVEQFNKEGFARAYIGEQKYRVDKNGGRLRFAEKMSELDAKTQALDLSERKRKGERIDGADIRKHKNDVFRMFQIIEPAPLSRVPEQIRQNMAMFLSAMEAEEIDLKALGIRSTGKADILAGLRIIYCS